MKHISIEITKDLYSILRSTRSTSEQGILLGIRNSFIQESITLTSCLSYTSNGQELLTLLAANLNNDPSTVLGWYAIVPRSHSIVKIVSAYFETFFCALVKVAISYHLDLQKDYDIKEVAKQLAPEIAFIFNHFIGLIVLFVFLDAETDQSEMLRGGIQCFHCEITNEEAYGKLLSMDLCAIHLDGDPLELKIMNEVDSTAHSDVETDILTGKKLRPRRLSNIDDAEPKASETVRAVMDVELSKKITQISDSNVFIATSKRANHLMDVLEDVTADEFCDVNINIEPSNGSFDLKHLEDTIDNNFEQLLLEYEKEIMEYERLATLNRILCKKPIEILAHEIKSKFKAPNQIPVTK
ncbi:hypothetical protein O9G_000866 [Rozella allomycis CSF55]|uniref:Uncharacterized protein n=1 Tax=Rozella allomycis (strain CSF55) TaxID=988480 RepID=A0A075AR72_ROZAC|nr:hypothetical protein O9G_000866 [Rozella allomycis CSF55]|eukprot:EPZ32791.1 hypothetical protein O9G_000866 [Rozella allomycis CSF55]